VNFDFSIMKQGNNESARLLIYGATGYTGTLICHEAISKGIDFEIAGRNEADLIKMASELGVAYHCFPVDDGKGWDSSLSGKSCLLNIAGPFAETADYAMKACLKNGVHYVDISAEVLVYALAESKDAEAETAGIMIMSGAGLFVTYDPLVIHTAKRIQDPVSLRVAFKYSGGFTPGSVASSTHITNAGLLVRKNGEIQELAEAIPVAFDFGDGPVQCQPTPLGGIIHAFKSTGISDIEEFFQMALPTDLKNSETIKLENGKIGQSVKAEQSIILAEVTGAQGDVVRSMAKTPAGYMPTVNSAVEIVSRILSGNYQAGFQTPGSAYGERLLDSLDVEIIDL
jgi:short subunit dehydrogenase-like uncharacterized protein